MVNLHISCSFGFIYFFYHSHLFFHGLPSIWKFWYVAFSVSIDFLSNSKQVHVQLHRIAYDDLHANWDGLHNHLRDVSWKDIFKLGVGANVVILGDIFEILWHPFYLLEFDLRTLNQQKNLKFCHFSDTAPSKTENDPKFTIFKKNQVCGNMVKF